MGPRRGRWQRRTGGEREVHSIERNQKLIGVPDLGERIDHSSLSVTGQRGLERQYARNLLSSFPHEALVLDPVSVIHASLDVCWQVFLRPCGRIVSIEAERKLLEPVEHLSDVILASVSRYGILDDREAFAE